MIFQEFML